MLRAAGGFVLPALLSLFAACSDESSCNPTTCPTCSCDNPLAGALEDSLNDNDDDTPCGALADGACQRSGRCVMDSICVACTGPGCRDSCELVRACVPN